MARESESANDVDSASLARLRHTGGILTKFSVFQNTDLKGSTTTCGQREGVDSRQRVPRLSRVSRVAVAEGWWHQLKELRVTSADVECELCSHERDNEGDHDQCSACLVSCALYFGTHQIFLKTAVRCLQSRRQRVARESESAHDVDSAS